MNENTHKTIRVYATMETELYVDINVPINTDDDDIWQFIRDGNIDGGHMDAIDDLFDGGWRWQMPDYGQKFDPDALDFSEEILES